MILSYQIDGVSVTSSEVQKAIKHCLNVRSSIASYEQLKVVFDDFIRNLRSEGKGGNYIA